MGPQFETRTFSLQRADFDHPARRAGAIARGADGFVTAAEKGPIPRADARRRSDH
jgi:hypothetical protein